MAWNVLIYMVADDAFGVFTNDSIEAELAAMENAVDQHPETTVIVRADSSASYGTETVRWRIVGDSLALALGGEWVNYRLKLKGKRLTLSGGDLTEPVTFDLVGPPTPRPDTIPIPPDPDTEPI